MRSQVEVVPASGPDKAVTFSATGERVTMGMHGALAEFYGAHPEEIEAKASTLDFVVGATTACLLGTFRRALTAREVSFDGLVAQGTGHIVVEKDVPVLRSIDIEYRLTGTSAAQRTVLERAHDVHDRACAVSRSLAGAIEIRTTLVVEGLREDD
ncbi:MAG TPA: OsmC family protein [Solirubrobacterales bacterium]